MEGSRSRIQVLARNRKRMFLRRARLRASDLDAVTGAHLDAWARAAAVAALYVESGQLGKETMTAMNSEARALRALEVRLREVGSSAVGRGQRPEAKLSEYLAGRNGGGEA